MGLFGKSGLQGLPTRVALPLWDIQLRLSKGATGVHLFTTWDSVAGPGRTPMPGNNSGQRQPGNSAVPSTVGRLGVECKRVFITNVKGTFFGMSESEEASKRR